jgi:oxaloacetate decarboxylase gamma subunit
MTILTMLQQSVILTVFGMAIVFAFLWLMILCVNVIGKIIHKAGLDKDVREPEKAPPKKPAVKPEVIAAISAAVARQKESETAP